MNFNNHSKLEGLHAFLGASKYHWLNYDEKRLREVWSTSEAAARGTELHDFAARCIRLRQKLEDNNQTLNMYVNDAIGYLMTPEVVLYYSDFCFGTTDAISFRDNFLRIHDFKSGSIPAHFEQLEIYDALFCLEYGKDPNKIEHELRIYQSQQVLTHVPDPKDIRFIMEKIINSDKILNQIKGET